jgi:hypothetical protein
MTDTSKSCSPDRVTIHGEGDAKIVIRINEKDGTKNVLELWPDGPVMINQALKTSPRETAGGWELGEIEVDDTIRAEIGDETLDAEEIGKRMATYIADILENDLKKQQER